MAVRSTTRTTPAEKHRGVRPQPDVVHRECRRMTGSDVAENTAVVRCNRCPHSSRTGQRAVRPGMRLPEAARNSGSRSTWAAKSTSPTGTRTTNPLREVGEHKPLVGDPGEAEPHHVDRGPPCSHCPSQRRQAQGMAMNPSTQYATDHNLASRQRLWWTSRRVPEFDLFSWVLDLAGVTQGSTQSVLDVGCGNGAYERALVKRGHRAPRVALDLSVGMLPIVTDAVPVLADVQALPFSRACFDLVLAPHMLYHVPDIEAAAQEIRRVLHPDGLFVAVTNSVSNLQELRALVEAAVGTDWRMLRPSDQRFSMESGAAPLSSAFESVLRLDCPPSHLVVTDVGAVAEYVASVADHYESEVDIPWADVVRRVHELASAAVSADGELRFTTGAGAFVCR